MGLVVEIYGGGIVWVNLVWRWSWVSCLREFGKF